jgi:hypothetical protein
MKGKLLLSIGLAGLLLALMLGLLAVGKSPVARADSGACDRYLVNGGNDSWPDNNCSDPNNPCKTVQYALGWALDGETICVADRDDLVGASTYYGPIVITKSVTLDGAWAAHPNPLGAGWMFTPTACHPENVVLSGNRTARVISITNASPTIRCFTITGGNASNATGDAHCGGGIAARDAAPIIVSNIITGNYGCQGAACTGNGRGGGICMVNILPTAVISNNLIANNVADNAAIGQGGGLYLEDASPQVLSNTIQGNRAGQSAGDGGGIFAALKTGGPLLIADNYILQNVAGQADQGDGGGIFVWSSTPVTIERNRIELNNALRGTASAGLYSRGGGIYFDGPLAVIRDNRLKSNVATLLDRRGLGGGMYLHGLSASAVVAGNVVAYDNRASYRTDGRGGGIYLDECYATVMGNQVFGNMAASSAPAYGGGIYVNGGGGVIQGNVITGNSAILFTAAGEWAYGGGMAVSGSMALVQDNLIARNTAAWGSSARGVGGGVYVWAGAPRFVANRVLSNTTGGESIALGFGGGFALAGASPWLEGNIILDNQAIGAEGGTGGGVDIRSCHYFTLTNNIIARNGISTTGVVSASGSGIYIGTSGAIIGRVAHNTIVANLTGDGVGVYVDARSQVLLYNNIIVSQTVGITNAGAPTSTVTADHTLFEGNGLNYGAGVTSTNEVSGPAGLTADYHLQSGSNAIGHAITLTWVTRDIDGDPRPLGLPDVGADEYVLARIYLPLVLRNS